MCPYVGYIVVYLGDSNKSPTAPDNESYKIDTLESPSGKQSYVLPSNIGLGDYDNVLIHCKEFDVFWGGGTLSDSVCGAVKVGQLNNKDLTVRYHPNPFQYQLYIEFEIPVKGEVNLAIVNSAGILYHKEKMEHNKMMFNTQNYPAELYYLNVIMNSNVYSYPILKE